MSAPLNVVMLSGGKDSTAMLLMMIERCMRIDRIICIDTTKEFPEMSDHINKLQEYISPYKIEVYKIPFDYYFADHIKIKGKRKGLKGYGWADHMNRWCTTYKQRKCDKVLNGLNRIEFHGIAFDEEHRTLRNKKKGKIIKYPLYEWGVTEKEALEYCYDKGFFWGGLYEKFERVSCFCCPLQRIGELKEIYLNRPELWEKMRSMDNKSKRRFRRDYTLKQLEEKFDREVKADRQLTLFACKGGR